MNRNRINYLIPKVAVTVIASLLLILVIVGLYKDATGEVCSGFMGAQTSCVEAITFWPTGLIGVALLGFFGAWWLVNYLNKSIKSKDIKKKK